MNSLEMNSEQRPKIRVAIVGVGNCSSPFHFAVSRLLAVACIALPHESINELEVDHKDGRRGNNEIDNLQAPDARGPRRQDGADDGGGTLGHVGGWWGSDLYDAYARQSPPSRPHGRRWSEGFLRVRHTRGCV